MLLPCYTIVSVRAGGFQRTYIGLTLSGWHSANADTKFLGFGIEVLALFCCPRQRKECRGRNRLVERRDKLSRVAVSQALQIRSSYQHKNSNGT